MSEQVMSAQAPLRERTSAYLHDLQSRLCAQLGDLDGVGDFKPDGWGHPGGGGGITAVLTDGDLFEQAVVNTSTVWGEFEAAALRELGGVERHFFATGISVILHPRSPMVPTVHANARYFERGRDAWFGGVSDLTPYYPYKEDAIHFHRHWKAVCDRHDPGYYARFKRWCDEYFSLAHRGEMRGIGGIFFDDLRDDLGKIFAFVHDFGDSFLEAYVPIAQRRRGEPYGERERQFQLYRRGRYAEFNLLYDRGTRFGLVTRGRTESILAALPPLARWQYNWQPPTGSREAQAAAFFQPHDWIAEGEGRVAPPPET